MLIRRKALLKVGALLILVAVASLGQGRSITRPNALDEALRTAMGSQRGAAVVVRVQDARVLAAYDIPVLTRRLATPGSSLKPFTLHFLLENHLLKKSDRIACRRTLTVGGMRLNCSHVEGLGAFDAEEALAFSCNSYFTEAAKRLPPGELEHYLRELGFEGLTGLMAGEAEGRITLAQTVEKRQLLAIGAAGIEITPLELAMAYTCVARWQNSPTAAQRVVLDGLAGATEYGLAQLAQTKSVKVAGKTGTAANPGSVSTHGWFAGFAPVNKPQVVVVVYVERGRGGAEAAIIAHRIFESWESGAR
jgi:cell division protein FtsI/penicillin-binding protein 2